MDTEPGNIVQVGSNAMATRFEIVLRGQQDSSYLRAAGEEALAEIARIEKLLSAYRSDSDLFHLNLSAGNAPARISAELFRFLSHAKRLSDETDGAFDLSVGPLMRCWGFVGNTGAMPSEEEIETALHSVGSDLIIMEEANQTVQFSRSGALLDPGAIGKGYALERASDILRELDIDSALMHGGTSSVYGLGHPPESAGGWPISLLWPIPEERVIVNLHDLALSVSAPHGKWFEAAGRQYGHVIHPRSGRPTGSALLSAVVCVSATESDALSTALLVLGSPGIALLRSIRPSCSALILEAGEPPKLSITGDAFHITNRAPDSIQPEVS